ncbi:MAG TPA: cytochrome o ubiquinol oxidase subunit III [Steroidobacteraceae bacterium]|jgi:cytochrome o ubiquinol oxidase subunit 3
MNTVVDIPTEEVSEGIPLSELGPASPRIVAAYGFWLFLLSDIIIFAALFAAYAVLSGATNGGPTGLELFDDKHVLEETACLLASSFTCGMMMLATERRQSGLTYFWSLVTALLGASFLALEFSEFADMVQRGDGPSRSAFLSSFFALVGTHGAHVTVGIAWLIVMMAQIGTLGFRPMVVRRLLCFSLFWHALDIVWIGVFTVVYLGAHS